MIRDFSFSIKKYLYDLLLIVTVAIIVTSCSTLNRDVMFEASLDYKYDTAAPLPKDDYIIRVDDKILLEVYVNEGYDIIKSNASMYNDMNDPTWNIYGGGNSYGSNQYNNQYGNQNNNQYNNRGAGNQNYNYNPTLGYVVESNGYAKLPVLGKVLLAGLTLREAEKILEEKYSEYFSKPFLKLRILNRRVTVLGAINSVYYLQNEHTTLLEVLGAMGGLPPREAKAYNIKLIRGNLNNPEVKLINLATINGMKEADLVLKSDDVIYIEPIRRISESIAVELDIIIGLLNSILLLAGIFIAIK